MVLFNEIRKLLENELQKYWYYFIAETFLIEYIISKVIDSNRIFIIEW